MSELDLLLDERRLEGVRGVERRVGPDRIAAVVSRDDVADAREAIEDLCLCWGGATGALLPYSVGVGSLSERWEWFLRDGVFDRLATRELLSADEERQRPGVFAIEAVQAEPLLTVLHGFDRARDDWAPVDTGLPTEDDPWHLAYLGTLGAWPDRPRPWQLRVAGLVEDFEFDRMFEVSADTVSEPGPDDLVWRLRRRGWNYPARLSVDSLGLWPGPEASHMSDVPPLPSRGWERSRYGANFVVVYEPGSVEDLALLWNLRASHALPAGLPLAVPVSTDVVRALRLWSTPGSDAFALRLFGLITGRPWGLVSVSVAREQLEDFAKQAGPNWAAADIDVVLHPGERATRASTDVATFVGGEAQVPALAPADRDILGRRGPHRPGLELRVRLAPKGRRLPPAQTFKRFLPTLEGYQGGGAERAVQRVDDLVRLDWPSGWAVLEAAVRDRGFNVRPSRSGRAAVALLQRLASFDELQPLLASVVVDELVRLGTRSGSAWFEQKVRDLQQRLATQDASAAAKSAEIERQLAELRLRPFEADRVELTYSSLKNRLGAQAAREWLGWAEGRELLVRGAEVSCERCGASSWRPAAALAPPVVCSGCGQRIARPFRPDILTFRYRASEPLLQVLALNVLPHILALRWLCSLLGSHGLYGGHPGVEFLDGDDHVVGEADVLLLMQDGSLALGECKLTPRGLNQAEVDKLERLADVTGAEWTFYSTPHWLDELGPVWTALTRGLPERPRHILSAEQVLTSGAIFWMASDDPFGPPAADTDERQRRHEQFAAGLPSVTAALDRRYHLDRILLDEP